jgi:hypothetical protein
MKRGAVRAARRKDGSVNLDETLVKIDCLCNRLEDVLADLQRLAENPPHACPNPRKRRSNTIEAEDDGSSSPCGT